MKKLVALALAVIIALTAAAALAETPAPSGEYLMSNGVTAGMSSAEVIAIEGAEPSFIYSPTETYKAFTYYDRRVSKYPAWTGYVFINDRLVMAAYQIRDLDDEAYLCAALTSVYGEGSEMPMEVYDEWSEVTTGKRSGSTDSLHATQWKMSDATMIWLVGDGTDYMLMYVPVNYRELVNVTYDTTGL